MSETHRPPKNRQLPPADDPLEIIRWALDRFAGWRSVATSGLGMEGCVLLDLLDRAEADLEVLFIDTGLLFSETLELRERLAQRYPRLTLRTLTPRATPEEQAAEHGEALWLRDPDRCCSLRKVQPLAPALEGVDVWFTGLRRQQSETRADIHPVEWDWQRQLLKVHPLATWSRARVWRYAQEHEVPTNPLHLQGYPTLGCTPCTEPVAGAGPETESRAGRWAGRAKTECGLHLPSSTSTADADRTSP
ncbi:MAG: phosphoadenylyl-sulfate reductase [Acidobacteriota bacterium]